MKMLFQRLCLTVFVVVALAATGAICTDRYSGSELEIAFKRLERHFIDTVGVGHDDDAYLKAAKEAQRKFEWGGYLPRAAKIFVYLKTFDTCKPKTIDYIWHVIRGRPNGVPGHVVYYPGRPYSVIDKTPFDMMLELILKDAGNKCKSFLNDWYKESEAKIDAKSKELLHRLFSHQDINEGIVYNVGGIGAKKTLDDAKLKDQLFKMDEDQLRRFYRKYLEENFAKPCKSFLAKVGPVLRSSNRFFNNFGRLFDEMSQDLSDDLVRLLECGKHKDVRYLESQTDRALEYVKEQKDPEYAMSKKHVMYFN